MDDRMYKKLFSDTNNGEQRGTSYIRWGRKTCENNATLVYKGASCSLYEICYVDDCMEKE